MNNKKNNLVWIDLEMTGLNPSKNKIIEIATIITDTDLNILEIGPVIAINQTQEVMDNMDEWCIENHGKSGLTKRVLDSKISHDEAENITLEFIKKWVDEDQSPLCGNTIGQDRKFLDLYMPKIENYLNYRSIDVSSIKELAKRWNPDVAKMIKKEKNHLALDDIKESIYELKMYKEHFFKF